MSAGRCLFHPESGLAAEPKQDQTVSCEAHYNQLAGKLLSRLKSRTMLLADRGYDADWISTRFKRGVLLDFAAAQFFLIILFNTRCARPQNHKRPLRTGGP